MHKILECMHKILDQIMLHATRFMIVHQIVGSFPLINFIKGQLGAISVSNIIAKRGMLSLRFMRMPFFASDSPLNPP